MGSVLVATSFLSIFYIYSTFFGRIKALWGANPPFRGHNPAIFTNRLTLFDKPAARYPEVPSLIPGQGLSRRFPRPERRIS